MHSTGEVSLSVCRIGMGVKVTPYIRQHTKANTWKVCSFCDQYHSILVTNRPEMFFQTPSYAKNRTYDLKNQ